MRLLSQRSRNTFVARRRRVSRSALFGWLVFASVAWGSGLLVRGASAVLTAEEIINRAVERTKAAEQEAKSRPYTYSRVSVVEDINDQGKVAERKEKNYLMIPIGGVFYQRLIQANGKPLSEKERKREEEKERNFRQRLAQSQPAKGEDKQRIILGRELVSRFQFKIEELEMVEGRSAYVLSFVSRSDVVEKKVDDRVLNRLAGKLWIDVQEFEMAKIEFHLTEKVSIGWGGMLASLQKFAFILTRTRVAEGVWFNHHFRGDIEGRKLLGTLRLKIQDEASDFKQAPAETTPVKAP